MDKMSKKGTLLIVDDEPININMLSEILKAHYSFSNIGTILLCLHTLGGRRKKDPSLQARKIRIVMH
jgi:hypothetical protein